MLDAGQFNLLEALADRTFRPLVFLKFLFTVEI